MLVYLVRDRKTGEFHGRNWGGSANPFASPFSTKGHASRKKNEITRTTRRKDFEVVAFKFVEIGPIPEV